jgi:MOSC domain-containing protein YiiM
MHIVSLRVGQPRSYGTPGAAHPFDRPWVSAIAKEEVAGALWLGREGLEGDAVADRSVHGGPEKAVLAGAVEHLPFWRELLGRADLGPGAFGENLVLEGALEQDVCIGDSSAVGGALVQVSQPRQPCWKQARRWRSPQLALQMQRTGRTGWYLRVLREGHVQVGDALLLVERPYPTWTVARANAVMHGRPVDREAAAAQSELPLAAARWRESLARLAAGTGGDGRARLVGPNDEHG